MTLQLASTLRNPSRRALREVTPPVDPRAKALHAARVRRILERNESENFHNPPTLLRGGIARSAALCAVQANNDHLLIHADKGVLHLQNLSPDDLRHGLRAERVRVSSPNHCPHAQAGQIRARW